MHSSDIIKKSRELIEKMDSAMVEDKERAACIRHANEGHKMSDRCKSLINLSAVSNNIPQQARYSDARQSAKYTADPNDIASVVTSQIATGLEKYDEHKIIYQPPWTQENKLPYDPNAIIYSYNGPMKLGRFQQLFNNTSTKKDMITLANGKKIEYNAFAQPMLMMNSINNNAREIINSGFIKKVDLGVLGTVPVVTDYFTNVTDKYQLPGIRVPDTSSPDMELSGRLEGMRMVRGLAPNPNKIPKTKNSMEDTLKKDFGIPYVDLAGLTDAAPARDFYTALVHNIRIAPAIVHNLSYVGRGDIGGATAASVCHDGLLYNSSILGNYVKAQYEYKNAYSKNWHPVYQIIGVFHHEMGHKVDDTYDICGIPEIRNMYRNMSIDDISQNLSIYATASLSEFYAEAWSEFLTSPSPRSIAQEVGNITIARINQYESGNRRNI